MNIANLLLTLDPLTSIVLMMLSIVVACVLLFDANWMIVLVRNGLQSAPPPLFKAPIRIEGTWRRAGYLALAILVLVPMLMLPFMDIRPLLTSLTNGTVLIALVVFAALAIVAEITGRSLIAAAAATMIAALLIAPYLLAGSVGLIRYLVVIGITTTIVSLLFIIALIHKWVFGYRPRSRLGAGARLFVDGSLAITLLITGFWLRLG